MFEIINPLAVLVATVVAYLAGWAWYSSILWQKPWMEALGKTKEEWDTVGKKEMPKTMVYGFVSTLAIAFSVAVFLQITGATTLLGALQIGLLLCFGFVITTKFSDMIYTSPPPHWGKKAQQLFFIEAGYQIMLFSILSAVIFWLSK